MTLILKNNDNLKTKLAKHLRQEQAEALVQAIAESMLDKKGMEVVSLDLRHIDEAMASFFVICEANSPTQVRAIADYIDHNVREKLGERPRRIEGAGTQLWMLVDYFDVVAHIFQKEARDTYGLDELWNDAVFTQYTDSPAGMVIQPK